MAWQFISISTSSNTCMSCYKSMMYYLQFDIIQEFTYLLVKKPKKEKEEKEFKCFASYSGCYMHSTLKVPLMHWSPYSHNVLWYFILSFLKKNINSSFDVKWPNEAITEYIYIKAQVLQTIVLDLPEQNLKKQQEHLLITSISGKWLIVWASISMVHGLGMSTTLASVSGSPSGVSFVFSSPYENRQ